MNPDDSRRCALLIIDMMNDFFERQPALAAQRPRLVSRINELVAVCRTTGTPVIWIRAEFAPDLSDASLEMKRGGIHIAIAGTRGCEILPELNREARDPVVVKKRYSAFFNTDLEDRLTELDVRRLVVCGINTHACVRTTVIDAYQHDFDAVIADECVASYDAEHDAVTRRYLNGKIARFMPNADIVGMLTEEKAT